MNETSETPFPWECPYCCRITTITRGKISRNLHHFTNLDKNVGIITTVISCPNTSCNKYTIEASLHSKASGNVSFTASAFSEYVLIKKWQLIPDSLAKTFPDYIPKNILQDYDEACLILTLSSKASATLSRRCVQGIIRDFWEIKDETLYKEINKLESKIPQDTWMAIDSLRKIGNIGAHMEKDVNTIIDVSSDEAETLISLIEFLFREWYIKDHEHKIMLDRIVQIASEKKGAK